MSFKKQLFFFCFQCFVISSLFSQDNEKEYKNRIILQQSVFDFGGSEISFAPISTSIGYSRFYRNVGLGLMLDRIQLKKDGKEPILPYEEYDRKDNLELYYSNILVSYRFHHFCPLENLSVNIDLGPSILVGGKNSYYSLEESNSDSLIHNSFWKNPARMEYETKFNLFGRITVEYEIINHFKLGISSSTYLKYIAPELMSLNIPFSPGQRQLNKSSFWSLSILYSF